MPDCRLSVRAINVRGRSLVMSYADKERRAEPVTPAILGLSRDGV